MIERIAGVKAIFTVDDVRDRIKGILDGLLIKWITKVGGDVFNLMANATDIAKGILEDLDMELIKIGLTMTDFRISEFTYPENISKRADQAAEYTMLGDMGRFQQVKMVDALANSNGKGGANMADVASGMMGMQMGMMMANQMTGNLQNNMNGQMNQQAAPTGNGTAPKFCPNCGTPTNGAKFCGNCGTKLI